MKNLLIRSRSILFLCGLFLSISVFAQDSRIDLREITYKIYPHLNPVLPLLPSPFVSTDGHEFVIAVTSTDSFAIIEVTPGNNRKICQQLIVDSLDFPALVKTGLHAEDELHQTRSITGRSLAEITRLGQPGALSQGGFMAEDENILSVLMADNRIVKKLGLTHPQLAKPLFHVLNMMDTDLEIGRWNMARHRWENIQYFYYHGQKVQVEAYDTKGGQQSIFDDAIEGAFYIKIWREFEPDEIEYLKKNYSDLTADQFTQLCTLLSSFNTGEIQPQYIMRYGFHEGHTFWQTDPIAITFIFGIKDLIEIEARLGQDLFNILTGHFRE